MQFTHGSVHCAVHGGSRLLLVQVGTHRTRIVMPVDQDGQFPPGRISDRHSLRQRRIDEARSSRQIQ